MKTAAEAVEYRLAKQEKLALLEEIARYAAEMAGTGDDLDEQLEESGVEHLGNNGKKP